MIQPRRYYPRWGHEGVFPTLPLSYREPQQQQSRSAGSTPAGGTGPASNGAAEDDVSQAVFGAVGKVGGGGDGGSGGGEEENPSAAAVRGERRAERKWFRGLLADRFQHPFDLVRCGERYH